jgi:hypothetical protein
MDEQKKNNSFWSEVKDKLTTPWKQSVFIGLFILLLLLVAIAVIVPLLKISSGYIQSISISLSTFFIATIVASTIDLQLSYSFLNRASLIVYAILSLLIVLILFALSVLLSGSISLLPAISGFIISIIIWIIANADKDISSDKKHQQKMIQSIKQTNAYNEFFTKVTEEDE